jgi:hypothetical protein
MQETAKEQVHKKNLEVVNLILNSDNTVLLY